MRLHWVFMGILGMGFAVGTGAWQLSRIGINQGYSPKQPIAFPHKVHAGDNKIPCLYCHSAARTSRHAGIPPASVCMNCHAQIWNQSPYLDLVRKSYFSGQAIEWKRVHKLPDYAYFTHSQRDSRGDRLPEMPWSGGNHGDNQPGGSSHHGLVPAMPSRTREASCGRF
jgi:hypothetical protein